MSTRLTARGALVAALSSCIAFPAWSDSSSGRASGPDAPETVVVSATRIPTPELEVASSVTVLTADDLAARQERTVVEALKDIPGLNVMQQGGPGGEASVFIRGTNSNHTKVLIDGIDVGDPSNANGAFDFGQLLIQDIERIEVLRGPQSGLYGSDAIGGVINVITRSGSGPLRLEGSVEGGTFDTLNQTAGVSGSRDAFHYSANVAHFHAGATPVTPLDLLAAGEQRHDDSYDNFTASTRLGLDVTPDFDLGLVARYTNTQLRYTGEDYSNFPLDIPSAEQSTSGTNQYYARATAHLLSFDAALNQTLGIAYMRNRTATLQPQLAETLNTGERVKLDWQGAVRLSAAHTVLLGGEYARDAVSDPISASVHTGAGFAELQSQLGAQWFSALNVRYDDNSRFGSRATYRVAPAWVNASTGTKLKASVGSGFKAPTVSELYEDFPPYFFHNAGLRPESSLGYDLGFEQRLGAAVHFGATYFHNRIRDLITPDATGSTWANVGRASTGGIESFIACQPARQLKVRADYTYTQATDDVLHEELLRRPKHKGNLIVQWQATAALGLDLDVLTVSSWVDGNRDFSTPRLDAPPYTTVDLAAAWDLGRGWTLFGRADNLLDRRYQSPVGFLQPGLGVFAGVRTKL